MGGQGMVSEHGLEGDGRRRGGVLRLAEADLDFGPGLSQGVTIHVSLRVRLVLALVRRTGSTACIP